VTIERLMPAGAIGDVDALAPVAMPLWLRRFKVAAFLFAALGAALFIAMAFGAEASRPMLAGAVFFLVLALMSAVAVLVARLGHREVAGRAALLSQAVADSPNAHLIVAPDGSISYANSAFRRFFPEIHTRPLEVIALSLAGDEAPPEFRRLETEAVEHGRASGRLAIRRSAGATLWFVVSASLLPRSPGYMLWSFEDITQRQEMAQVISEQEAPADFLDTAPTGFYSVDGEGHFLLINQTLADWFGRTPGELVETGARLSDFVMAGGTVPGPPYAPFAGGAEGAPHGEMVLRGRDDRQIYVSVSQSVVRAGDQLRTRSVVRDLTSEHGWAEALKRSRLRFQRLFADAPVGIALLGAGGRIEEANRALGALLGSSAADLIGRELADFVIGEDRGQVGGHIVDARRLVGLPTGEGGSGPGSLHQLVRGGVHIALGVVVLGQEHPGGPAPLGSQAVEDVVLVILEHALEPTGERRHERGEHLVTLGHDGVDDWLRLGVPVFAVRARHAGLRRCLGSHDLV